MGWDPRVSLSLNCPGDANAAGSRPHFGEQGSGERWQCGLGKDIGRWAG